MSTWNVNGTDYRVVWLHPQTHRDVFNGDKMRTIEPGKIDVYVVHESVAKGDELDRPPQGSPDQVAKAAQRAIGDILSNRTRIDFLRIAKQYPFGTGPDDQGLNGGGDPRANLNQQDKAPATGGQRINNGHLLQPGAFPEVVTDPAGQKHAVLGDLPPLGDAERAVDAANADWKAAGGVPAEDIVAATGCTMEQALEGQQPVGPGAEQPEFLVEQAEGNRPAVTGVDPDNYDPSKPAGEQLLDLGTVEAITDGNGPTTEKAATGEGDGGGDAPGVTTDAAPPTDPEDVGGGHPGVSRSRRRRGSGNGLAS